MKLAYARIVTGDVSTLVRFYREITGITPVVRNADYVAFPTPGLTLAISNQRTMDLYGSGATTPGANRAANGITWMVVSFYVPLLMVSLGLTIWQLQSRRGEPLAHSLRGESSVSDAA